MTEPSGECARIPRPRVWLCVLGLLAVNLAIVAKLFGVEYSAYNGSVEGTFIAIARVMAKHPLDWSWWPLWTMGMPFENSYLPFVDWMVAAWSGLTGLSPARSFHMVTAAFYVIAAPTLFWMALVLSRKLAASLMAALAYSSVSLSAILVPAIGVDAGGALHLRRLQAMVVYGEAPHIVALSLLPIAMVCFHRALTTKAVKWNLLAGVAAASVALSNAFGIMALALALLCWLAAFRPGTFWNGVSAVLAIGAVSYCWTAPWLSPSMMRAILAFAGLDPANRYTAASWAALAILSAGYVLLWWALRRAKAAAHLQFFVLLVYVFTGIVGIWYVWRIALVPEPHRYHLEMDMALMLVVVFGGAAIVERVPKRLGSMVVVVAAAALALQIVHAVAYAGGLIRSVDPARLSEYGIAKWMDQNRHGQRGFISGSASFLFNVFTDNPQVRGGHAQFEVNSFIRTVDFTVYTGTNTGGRDAEYSVFWLKAVGARAISVSGPNSTEFYKPFVHPRKFDGVLPLLWREGDDAIYEVPSRSASLAHVIPRSAVVTRRPADGLDTAPAAAYVAALDDPRYAPAKFEWRGTSEANIRATVDRGQVVAVQETYDPGWEAWANGRRQPIREDALGLMVIEPDANGACEIRLRYTGGTARMVTRALSLAAMLLAAIYAWCGRRRWAG
jgi:hypothetical protein